MLEILLTVTLTWTPPSTRVNGDILPAEDIGGYEIIVDCPNEPEVRYKAPAEAVSMEVSGTKACDYFIATYDTNGLYSDYAKGVNRTVDAPSRGGIR